jgi:hypothetical protein
MERQALTSSPRLPFGHLRRDADGEGGHDGGEREVLHQRDEAVGLQRGLRAGFGRIGPSDAEISERYQDSISVDPV